LKTFTHHRILIDLFHNSFYLSSPLEKNKDEAKKKANYERGLNPFCLLVFLLFGWWNKVDAQFTGSTRVDYLLSASAYDAGQAELILIKDNKVVYKRVFSDVQSASEKKVRVAGSSKWLVAATLLTLVDEKRIALDEPIGKYLPQFKSVKATITLRQLLSHTSGLPANVPYLKNKELSLAQSVDSIARKTMLVSDPGTQFLYGNTSYQVAARLAEVVSGKDWESLFKEKIAQPCKMYKTDFGNQKGKNIGEGAYSTATDFSNFLVMLLNKGSYDGAQVLTQKSVQEMFHDQTADLPEEYTPYKQTSTMKSQFYGLGVSIDRMIPLDNIATEVSSQGDKGFTPWINLCKNLAGVYSFYVDLSDVAATIDETKLVIDDAFKDYCKDVSTKSRNDGTNVNPAAKQTNIFFRLERESKVILNLFDPLGNEVMQLKNGMLKAGDYSVPVDIARLNQGVYFYRLEIDGVLETKRITIKK